MGLFSSGGTKLPKWAKPFAVAGLNEASNVYNTNRDNLAELSGVASDAAMGAAGRAFGENPFLDNAKAAARTISNGFFLGQNPGQGTFDRLQARTKLAPGQPGDNNPAMGLLSGMATNQTPGAGTSLIRAGASGANPGDQFAAATAQGEYLNRQPSAGLYGEMMDRRYSTSNPFLDDIIRQNDENVTLQANRLFGSRGMGAGISSAFADVLSKNLANTGGQLRFQDYTNAENRRLQAAGQSDAAFANERGNMMQGAGLLSNNFNAGMDRALAAGQALNQFDQGSRAQQLSAAQSLGDQFDAGTGRNLQQQAISLDAAQAADASRNTSIAQMLQALGLTGQLSEAEFAGYDPATRLLSTAATLPYTGLDAYQTALSNLLGTTRKEKGPGLGYSVWSNAAQGAASASDRRLKRNVEKLGEFDDGLGVYRFEYIDGQRFGEGYQIGVMADEVEKLRPWALGPLIDGKYGSVDYSKLEAA